MLDFLFRLGNPTNGWSRDTEMPLIVDLSAASVNSIEIGSRVDEFSFLGRSSSRTKSPLVYADLGMAFDYQQDGTISCFQLVLSDPDEHFSGFTGKIEFNGLPISPTRLLEELGECYWLDRDEDELLYFFELPTHEIQVEQSHDKTIMRITVTRDALMADAEQRQFYGVDKAWPPF